MRGLKALNHDAPDKNAKVASYADAWIKVKHSLTVYPQTHVASLAERMDERSSQTSVLCIAKVMRGLKEVFILRKQHGRILQGMRGLKVYFLGNPAKYWSRIPRGMRG